MNNKTRNQSGQWVRGAGLGLLLLLGSSGLGAPAPAVLKVNVSESVTLPVGKPVTKLAIADPAIADVVVLSENEVSVIGKKGGVTTLSVCYPPDKPTELYRIEVSNGTVSQISALLADPGIEVHEAGDAVVLDGQVEDELRLQRAVQVTEACRVKVVNLLEVKKPRQVSIRIRVAEVLTDAAKQVGFTWFGPQGEIQYAMAFGGLDSMIGQISHGFIQSKSSSDTSQKGAINDNTKPGLDVVLQLLVDNNCARLLSEPTLLTKSGSEASFLVGQEYPIVQVLPNSVTVEYKKIGVNMRIKPTADSKNRITTGIHAEVSQVTGILPGQVSIPIIGTKTSDTTLQVADGQTIVIGGLLENNISQDDLRKVPWLGDIPLFGYLFRHKAKQQEQREVMFFMTPMVVKDVDAATASAIRTPLMNQWSGKATDKVLGLPKRDEPNFIRKGAKAEPMEPAAPQVLAAPQGNEPAVSRSAVSVTPAEPAVSEQASAAPQRDEPAVSRNPALVAPAEPAAPKRQPTVNFGP